MGVDPILKLDAVVLLPTKLPHPLAMADATLALGSRQFRGWHIRVCLGHVQSALAHL